MLQVDVPAVFTAGAGCRLDPVFAYHTKAVDDYLRCFAPKWNGIPVTEASGVSALFEPKNQLWTPALVRSKGPFHHTFEQEYVQQYVHLLNKPVKRPRSPTDKGSSHLEQYLQDSLAAALSQMTLPPPDVQAEAASTPPIQEVNSHPTADVQPDQKIEANVRTQPRKIVMVETDTSLENLAGQQPVELEAVKGIDGKVGSVPITRDGTQRVASDCPDWLLWDDDMLFQKPLKPLVVPTKVNEHKQFFTYMLYGFLISLALLPVLWFFEQVVKPLVPAEINKFSVIVLAPVLLGALVQPLHECTAHLLGLGRILHFQSRIIEQRFLYWFGTSRMFLDIISHTCWFVAGACIWMRVKEVHREGNHSLLSSPAALASLAGMVTPLMPFALLLFSRWELYAWRRESLLILSRTAFTLALLYVHCMAPEFLRQHLTVPFVVLAQLVTTASMQIRLSSFIPTQLVYLLVVMMTLGRHHTLLHTLQLCGFGFCLPAMLLYSMEVYSRHAFLSVLSKEAASNKCQSEAAGGAGPSCAESQPCMKL